MSIEYSVLGLPGRDNALYVRLSTGQSMHRFLFDCGQGCLDTLGRAEIQAIDHVLFSHFHIDHISGFDAFFRATYFRTLHHNVVWGPPEATEVMHARFRGFTWNLQEGMEVHWHIHAIHPDRIERTYADLGDGFTRLHVNKALPFNGILLDEPAFVIEAIHLDHGIPTIGYILREKPHVNVDPVALAGLGLEPGPWLQAIKRPPAAYEPPVEVGGRSFRPEDLRKELLRETPGDSIAYLTDFLLTEETRKNLTSKLQGCATLICESTYRRDDIGRAERNLHLTSSQAAELAREAAVGRLVLMHVSDRYTKEEWLALLSEAREIFPNAVFPEHWETEGEQEKRAKNTSDF
jgi:ribonuclease Z